MWQRPTDLPIRRMVLWDIVDMVHGSRPRQIKWYASAGPKAARIERHLYLGASAIEEYLCRPTLRRRVRLAIRYLKTT
jgi:hypothetical protein